MMKFLILVFGAVAMECADAKFWHGNDRYDETFRIFLWIGYLKRLSLIAFMLICVLLYYVPESRTHARKICFFLIDSIADGLKLILHATENENERTKKPDRRYFEYVDRVSARKRRFREKSKIARNEARRRESKRTSSWYRDLEGKYQHRPRARQRYRETCLRLTPVLRNRYRTCAVLALNDTYPVRLEKEYETITNKANRREDIFYSKEEDVVGYEDDFQAIDSGISTNFYDSPSNRHDRNVANVTTYRREIVGDNEYLADTNDGRSTIRQMQGDTIPEISCNENSYSSIEAEADDENSQGENETIQTNFSNETEIGTKINIEDSTIDDVSATTNRPRIPFVRAIKWIFGGCPGTCRRLSSNTKKESEKKIVGKEEIRERVTAVIDEWLCT